MSPDATSSDDELYAAVVAGLERMGPVTAVRPGVLQVEIPIDEESPARTIEMRMTASQLRESVTTLAAGGQEALGIADPVAAGFALFTIHLEEHVATLRQQESFLLWHQGTLHPSVSLSWPPERGEPRW